MGNYKNFLLTPAERADDLLARMSLREKVGQLNQKLYGFDSYIRKGSLLELTADFKKEVKRWGGLGVLYGLHRADPWSKRNFSTGLEGTLAIQAYNLAQKYVIEHSRFGIPMLLSSECPHGHQALDGYLLPVNLAMGAAWNPELVDSAFNVCAGQMKELGVNLALISMLDVLRDPRWGRSEECYSEDPYICSIMAAAAVKGCQSQGMATVAKHFCAQGEGTGGINASAARIGERELREIHLPPAYAACRAGVQGIMAAYNEIDGVPCHGSSWLLQEVLRTEMNFQGVVMADGTAIDRLDVLTGDPVGSGALALNSGIDISLWDEGFASLEEAMLRGLITEKRLDEAVRRVLELKFAQGLFEKPYLEEQELRIYSAVQFPQSLELARQSAILLKNDGLLPLDASGIKSIAVIGPNADNIYNQLGDYTPPLREEEGITVLQGIRDLCPEHINIRYAEGCSVCGTDESGIKEAVNTAACCDAVILVLGGSSSRFTGADFDVNGAALTGANLQMDCGEGVDSAELSLPGVQQELARRIFAAGKPVVTVLIQGRPYAIPYEAENSNAVLCSFYPGPMGGQALAEILLGRICPSGCLPVSIPRSAGQLPVYYNHKASYEAMKYADMPASPLFPFGFGLSYTDFDLKNIRLDKDTISLESLKQDKNVLLHVDVTNAGTMEGYAVLQLFIRDLQANTVRRIKELKCFNKVALKPGEKKSCKLSLGYDELAIWDNRMHFCVEPGDFLLELMESGRTVWSGKVSVE